MDRRHIGGGTGLAALAVVACCGVTTLLAAGLAGAALWGAGLGLAGTLVVVVGVVLFVRRRRRACDTGPVLDVAELPTVDAWDVEGEDR